MINHDSHLFADLQATRLSSYARTIADATAKARATIRHGDLQRWQDAIDNLPVAPTSTDIDLTQNAISIDSFEPLATLEMKKLRSALMALCPWRKGPFHLLGVNIDSEWRCDWKWNRLADHIGDLAHRRVLDVGSGNGYYVWRMLGAGADVVIGIDPSVLFNMQFKAVQHFANQPAAMVLPLKLEQFPKLAIFDTVFSMGVIYHRRNPIAHLNYLYSLMAPGAELVLESLVIPPDGPAVLYPNERYARMRNVWQVPTTATLCEWLNQCKFKSIEVVSENTTTTDEQRTTRWMQFESLAEALDPEAQHLTVEGYPAPRRVIVLAHKSA